MGLDLFDIIIILIVIGMLIRGYFVGFLRQFFAGIGFFGGIFLGAVITPHLVRKDAAQSTRSLLTLLITIGVGVIFLTLGEYVGFLIKRKVKQKVINHVDSFFGALIGGITILASLWLAASLLAKWPNQTIQSEVKQSSIIAALNKALPSAPSIVTKLDRLIDPNGFPQVFVGNEPAPAKPVTLPTASSFQTVISQDSPSVVKIEGRGCGGLVVGSGFVGSDGYVLTNAHVVAGVAQPYVFDSGGRHTVKVVWFDPNLDFAVLKTSGLVGKPLKLDTSIDPRGTQGVVMGYPGGGDLTVSQAAVLDEFIATGRNIYNVGSTDREVYELQADVAPGNSGGPFITSNGEVSGIIFAQSTVYNHVGYALAMRQVANEFSQAKNSQQPVGTGSCAE